MDIILLAVAAALCCLAPLIIVGLIRDRSGNVDYNIRTLGTKALVDPDGKLLYWNEYPLLADGFAQLFDLATR